MIRSSVMCFACVSGLHLFSRLSLLSSVRPLSFPLSRHLLMQTCAQTRSCPQSKLAPRDISSALCMQLKTDGGVSAFQFPRPTSLPQSKKSTNLTSALPSMTVFHPWRLSSLRGKPSMRNRNFFASFCIVSSIALTNRNKTKFSLGTLCGRGRMALRCVWGGGGGGLFSHFATSILK